MNTCDILLTTANARYSHCAFGLKRIWSALGPLQLRARIVEFTIQQDAFEIAAALLEAQPRIIGLGVYLWNVELLTQVVHILRSVRPEIKLVVGGPELSHDAEAMPIVQSADYLVAGEGEGAFATLAGALLSGDAPEQKSIAAEAPDVVALPDVYDTYDDEDIRQRVLYVESSRGCPYRCAFCLSSIETRVRYFPLTPFFEAMARLLARGARHFKFTDRTFNLRDDRVMTILRFFLDQPHADIRLHLEIMPERLSDAVVELIAAFAPGALHLELGVQSVNPETQRTIGRNQNIEATMETITRLRHETGAALHADLIFGLPGDTREDMARGFDALVGAQVHEIQLGLLKRLKGAAIAGPLGSELAFDTRPPYEVLQTPTIPFEEIQRFKRLARYFDLYHNRGNFAESLALLWQPGNSPFTVFSRFSDQVWDSLGKTHKIPLARLAEQLYLFLRDEGHHTIETISGAIEKDFRRLDGRRDKLDFLG